MWGVKIVQYGSVEGRGETERGAGPETPISANGLDTWPFVRKFSYLKIEFEAAIIQGSAYFATVTLAVATDW